MYHSVGGAAVGDKLGIYNISPELFARQISTLAFIHGNAFAPLGQDPPPTDRLRISLSFDDGYRDNLYCAAPILQQHGVPFTVFACAGFIQSKSDKYLSKTELRELASISGATIGSHGFSHTRLTELDANALRDELVTSKRFLEDVTGREINSLSYPHGAANKRVRDAAENAGYKLGACSRFDINRRSCDPLMLSRTDILGIDSIRVFNQKLRGDWDWYQWRSTTFAP